MTCLKLLFGILFTAHSVAAVPPPSSGSAPAIVARHCDFGERYQFETASCRFQFLNSGDAAVRVSNLATTVDGDEVTPRELVIAPRATAEVDFRTNVGDRLGTLVRMVTFTVGSESRKVFARGFVLSDLDDAGQGIDFGTVDAAAGSDEQTLRLSSHEVADLRIERIVEVPDWIVARVGSDRKSVTARVKPGAPWFPQEGRIKLSINTPHQSQAWIRVIANLQGDVVPSANPYQIGSVRQGADLEFIVRLDSRASKPFDIGSLRSRGVRATLEELPCTPPSTSCAQIKATLPDDLPLGAFRGELLVELPSEGRELPITFTGQLVAAVVPPDRERTAPSAPTSDSSAPVPDSGAVPLGSAEKKLDIANALRRTVQQAEATATPPPGTGPLLTWTVINEQQIYGYMIYRAEAEAGPFLRVNPNVLKVASKGEGWTYQWRDNSARSGQAYWYYIATVSSVGKISTLSSPQKVVAK